jgi:hypothetical protein
MQSRGGRKKLLTWAVCGYRVQIVFLRLQIALLNLVEDSSLRTLRAKLDATGRFYHSMYIVQLDLDAFDAAWDSSRVARSHL